MPPTPKSKQPSTPHPEIKSTKKARGTLSELSQNVDTDLMCTDETCLLASVDGMDSVKLTKEVFDSLESNQKDIKEFLSNNLTKTSENLEVFGWSRGEHVPNSLYEILISPSLKIKQLTLRGRGLWNTCKCPARKKSDGPELIDIINPGVTTTIEKLYIMRPFKIGACTLLDLIARSPNLKVVRFYGVLIDEDHHSIFESVRFQCQLERLYWPWCNRKLNLPTLKILVSRNDSITTFYSNGDTTCDLLGSDLLPNLKHLSLILNESWVCTEKNMRKPNRYLKKIGHLAAAKKLVALEIRTFKLSIEQFDEGQDEAFAAVMRLFENYQLTFWENVARLPSLKYLAIYGAWELDSVARELSRHGLQIEHLKTNLVPSSMIPAIDGGEDLLILSISECIKELRKLTKLRSLHFACHENLANLDAKTVTTLKELADLIWVFDLRIAFTPEVEELISNILRRGNQQGKVFNIKIHIESSKSENANCYIETVLRFLPGQGLRQQILNVVENTAREKWGRTSYKAYHLWGIEQCGGRDKEAYDKLKMDWDYYNDVFQPIDMFA